MDGWGDQTLGKRTRWGVEKKPDKSWQYDGHSVQISRSLPKDSCSMWTSVIIIIIIINMEYFLKFLIEHPWKAGRWHHLQWAHANPSIKAPHPFFIKNYLEGVCHVSWCCLPSSYRPYHQPFPCYLKWKCCCTWCQSCNNNNQPSGSSSSNSSGPYTKFKPATNS